MLTDVLLVLLEQVAPKQYNTKIKINVCQAEVNNENESFRVKKRTLQWELKISNSSG